MPAISAVVVTRAGAAKRWRKASATRARDDRSKRTPA
jgi:hypothetical protein